MKKNNKNEPLITREGNELEFKNLSNPRVVCNFIEVINGSLEDEQEILLLICETKNQELGQDNQVKKYETN